MELRHRKIDAHLHVWAPKEMALRYPYADGSSEPPVPGDADVLLQCMKTADVDGALIVQPGNHKFDHSYVTSVLRQFPDKFVGCLLANPSLGGPAEMERLVKEDGYKAVRFNPYLWPEGDKMTNKVGQELYAKAGELGIPVAYMPFKGLLLHIDEIEQLCRQYPATTAIVDHFGFCKCSDPDSEEWKRLFRLADFPQVYVKVSAFFRVSSQDYPYLDARPCLRRLIDAFGANRLMWGTDFPWVTEQCGYMKAWSILDDGDRASGEALVTDEERLQIMGGTLRKLFPTGWQDK